MPSDFAPHNMTAFTAPVPYRASSSSSFSSSFEPWKAFDGGTAYWLGSGAGVDWLQLDPSRYGYLLDSYSIQVNSIPEPNRAPKNWTVQGSDNGSTWTTVDTRTNQTGWASGETRNFVCATRTTPYRYFRISITANNGDATFTQVAELYLFGTAQDGLGGNIAPTSMSNNTTPAPYVASVSSELSGGIAWYAFSQATDAWIGVGGGVDWLQIYLGSPYVMNAYDIQCWATPNRAPKNWTVKGSNNGSTWTTIDTQTNQTAWAAYERRSFICATTGTTWKYWRIEISANNGDGTYTEISTVYIYGMAGSLAVPQPTIQVIT